MLEQGHDPTSPEAAANAAVALQAALALCRERGTPDDGAAARHAGDALAGAPPLGAYGLLSRLEAVLGRKLTPASIYRVLEFLVGEGLIARIESRNGYVPCAHPERAHGCVFFVCDQCTNSVEIGIRPWKRSSNAMPNSSDFRSPAGSSNCRASAPVAGSAHRLRRATRRDYSQIEKELSRGRPEYCRTRPACRW